MSQQLPLYHPGTGSKKKGERKGPFRFKEAHLLMFLFVTFSLAWFVLVMYMPETQTTDTGFRATYQKFIHRTPNSIIPEPRQGTEEENSERADPVDMANTAVAQDGIPPSFTEAHEITLSPNDDSNDDTNRDEDIVNNNDDDEDDTTNEHNADNRDNGNDDGDDDEDYGVDTVTQERRDKVKEMIKNAWDGYAKYALGENELKPLSKVGHSAAIFGKTKVGATLVDSLDTLYIAGLMDEFNEAKTWVEESFDINKIDSPVSFFEFNIRFVGGLLSAYALSGEEVFKLKAVSLADKLMPVFNEETGIPSSFVNIQSGATKNWGWAKTSSVLSEIGTLHLEYQYLTEITENPVYLKKVQRIRKLLKDMPKKDGMYSTLISQKTQKFSNKISSLGALGDSFYEYLLKAWLITSKEDVEARDMYYEAIDKLETKMLIPRPGGTLMVTDFKNSRSDQSMQHLACFSGGMYALGAVNSENGKMDHYMSIARNITHACRKSYDSTATKLGPERFRVNDQGVFSSRGAGDKVYLLRPETVESYFYMWRLTHDPKYRDWGWDVVQALEKHCKTADGYSGIKDVYKDPPLKDDVQQSFFIAETLKYLYLLFSDDSTLPLDQWVFNTEAHPLPILLGIPLTSKQESVKDYG